VLLIAAWCEARARGLPEGARRQQETMLDELAYTNPVHGPYFADPFVWRHGGEYLAVGTGRTEAAGEVSATSVPGIFPLLRSRDLVQWRDAGHALVRPAAGLGDTFWAPEVAQEDGRWFMYYSVGYGDRRHQLRVACSDAPLGPYVDCAQLTDPDEVPFAIDPHPFRDTDGRWYLFHARDFLDVADEDGRPVRAGTALVVQPLQGMTSLAPGAPRTIARARCDWQRFAANRPMYGQVYDWHTLEGPFVVRHGGRYWCLYSGGCWQTETYGVDYLVADSVMGPYDDTSSQAGPRVLRSVPGHVIGPGHCCVTLAPDGRSPCIVYHSWGPDLRARRMCIDPLRFHADGPRSPGPSWTAQRLPI
jgi:GH43 family beta-xylosidase